MVRTVQVNIETLLNLKEVRIYTQTRQGREFAERNPGRITSNVVYPRWKEYAESQHVAGNLIYYSSKPSVALAFMQKHGFTNIREVRKGVQNIEDSFIITQQPQEVIIAHSMKLPSSMTCWPDFFANPDKAEPVLVAYIPEDLIAKVESFYLGNVEHTPRVDPNNYVFFADSLKPPEIIPYHLGLSYQPFTEEYRNSMSKQFRRFKNSKKFNWYEISTNVADQFYHNEELIASEIFLNMINSFFIQLKEMVGKMNLFGTTYVIPSPNSSPEYCYKTDVNHLIASSLNNDMGINDYERHIYRVFPKAQSYISGVRTQQIQFQTMGYARSRYPMNIQPNNIIIDV